jgi:hypothetical protein
MYSASQHVAKKAKVTITRETAYTNRLLVFLNFVKNWFVNKSIEGLCMQIHEQSFKKHYKDHFKNPKKAYIYDAEDIATNIVDSMHYTITCYNIFCQQNNYFASTTKDVVLTDDVFSEFLSHAAKMVKYYSTQVQKATSSIDDLIDDEQEEEEEEEEEGEDKDDDDYDPSNDPDKNDEDGDEEDGDDEDGDDEQEEEVN